MFCEQQKLAWVRTLSIIIEPSRSMHFLAAVRYFPIFLPTLNMLMLFFVPYSGRRLSRSRYTTGDAQHAKECSSVMICIISDSRFSFLSTTLHYRNVATHILQYTLLVHVSFDVSNSVSHCTTQQAHATSLTFRASGARRLLVQASAWTVEHAHIEAP